MKLSRRQFLKVVVVSAATTSIGLQSGCSNGGGDNIRIDETRFPQSVASGDPKPTSVVLWTRVEAGGSADVALRLQVATDAAFKELVVDSEVSAAADHDHCLKVKVVDLAPYTTYHYRFLLNSGSGEVSSPHGRTKTAPSPAADVAVKFGVVVCQDYIDGYYNAYALLLERDPDLDFIVHLGDYIYEQDRGTGAAEDDIAARAIVFPDYSSEAVVAVDERTYAARSLENYRHLYKVHHGDAMLKRVHERIPMVVIWDDHEYSDDCYGATGTYSNGLRDEADPERRRNSLQAFFEFLPVDEDFSDDFTATTPFDPPLNDSYNSVTAPGRGCWRTLRFGRHLDMFFSDYRTYRPDHLIPEDAFPGRVALDRATLTALFNLLYPGQGAAVYAAQSAAFSAYTSLADLPAAYAPYAAAYSEVLVGTLTQAYMQEGLAAASAAAKAGEELAGNISVRWFNGLLTQYNAAVSAAQQLPLLDEATVAELDRGVDYTLLGKTRLFSSLGARYGVVKATYDLLSAATYHGQAEDVLGAEQQQALDSFIAASDATFVCVANSVSTASLVWDLSAETLFTPIQFDQLFLANVDHWDGFPNRRQALLTALQARGNAFLISGDIHASFLTQWRPDASSGNVVPDFTTSSISSTVFNRFVEMKVAELATLLSTPEMQSRAQELLVDGLDDTLRSGFATVYPASELRYALTRENGYVVVSVAEGGVTSTYRTFPHQQAKSDAYGDLGALTVTSASFHYSGTEVQPI